MILQIVDIFFIIIKSYLFMDDMDIAVNKTYYLSEEVVNQIKILLENNQILIPLII